MQLCTLLFFPAEMGINIACIFRVINKICFMTLELKMRILIIFRNWYQYFLSSV